MPFRLLAIAALLLSTAPAVALPVTQAGPTHAAPLRKITPAITRIRPAEPMSRRTTTEGPPVMFYVAKGAPDACGPGCDRWIAVDGQINGDAAVRFKKFIVQHLKDRHLPIYLSSPGGNLEQALFIGNMLREMRATARVARTIVTNCGFEAQSSDICLKLKRSGRELTGTLATRGAQCNSACPYMMLGAVTREVAPDAILGVHSPKVILRHNGDVQPTREVIVQAAQRAVLRGDRLLSDYIFKMGVEGELLDVARHIRHQDMHVLTRDQIFRFGIDRREFVETPWMFENLGRPLIRKSAVARNDDGKTWRALQWRLFCVSPGQFQLEFHRPAVPTTTTAVLPVVSIASGATKPFIFAFPPAKAAGSEVWGLRLPQSSIQTMAGLIELDLAETANALDGRRSSHLEKLSGEGLAQSLDQLAAVCPVPKPQATFRQDGPQNASN